MGESQRTLPQLVRSVHDLGEVNTSYSGGFVVVSEWLAAVMAV